MSLATSIGQALTAFDTQPQQAAEQPCNCAAMPVGWSWLGSAWKPACGAHINAQPMHRIFNSEFQEDW